MSSLWNTQSSVSSNRCATPILMLVWTSANCLDHLYVLNARSCSRVIGWLVICKQLNRGGARHCDVMEKFYGVSFSDSSWCRDSCSCNEAPLILCNSTQKLTVSNIENMNHQSRLEIGKGVNNQRPKCNLSKPAWQERGYYYGNSWLDGWNPQAIFNWVKMKRRSKDQLRSVSSEKQQSSL